jgi:ABC-type spermidine/putrescine transport system permease subunit I
MVGQVIAAPPRPRYEAARETLAPWIAAALLLLLAGSLLLRPAGATLVINPALPALVNQFMPALVRVALAMVVGVPVAILLWLRGGGRAMQWLAPFLAPLLLDGLADTATLARTPLVIAQTLLLVPLMVTTVLATLARLDPAALPGAIACGASFNSLLARLVLPLALPGTLYGGVLGLLLVLQAGGGALPMTLQAVALALLAAAAIPWSRG